jgi:hypothetical protein
MDILVDIDGTLADCTHRLHHIQKQPKDWDAFFAGRGAGHVADPHTPAEKAKAMDAVEKAAVTLGIIFFDDLHHAPMCPANHYHKQRMPTGPCNCGAALEE